MPAERLARACAALVVSVALACGAAAWRGVAATRAPTRRAPSAAAAQWALEALEAARRGRAVPTPPAAASAYVAHAPVVVLGYVYGRPVLRTEHARGLVEAVHHAIAAMALRPETAEGSDFRNLEDGGSKFSVTVPLGEAPLAHDLPLARDFAYVPGADVVVAELRGVRHSLTPDERYVLGLEDGAIPTGLPDLALGVRLEEVLEVLARAHGVDVATLRTHGRLLRRPASVLARGRTSPSPSDAVDAALRDAAEFLLRHQRPDGLLEYEVDVRTGAPLARADSLPRQVGGALFLAGAGRHLGHRGAQLGARRVLEALTPLRREAGGGLAYCEGDVCDAALSALVLIVRAELARGGGADDDTDVAALATFLRAQQRADGEMRHFYDLAAGRPTERLVPYSSGEIALALLRAHERLGDPRDLAAASRVLDHLSRTAWSFPAGPYLHGEEHWTCIAAGEGRGRLRLPTLTDFCRSVVRFNAPFQLEATQTPWAVEGQFGIGPVFAPRVAATGTRLEAAAELARLLAAEGQTDPALDAMLRRGEQALLTALRDDGRSRFEAYPESTRGAVTGSVVDPVARVDHVQHVGYALLRIAELRAARRLGRDAVAAPRAAGN